MKVVPKKPVKVKVKVKHRRKKKNSILPSSFDDSENHSINSNDGNVRYAIKHMQYLAKKRKELEEKKKESLKGKLVWGLKAFGTFIGCIISVAFF